MAHKILELYAGKQFNVKKKKKHYLFSKLRNTCTKGLIPSFNHELGGNIDPKTNRYQILQDTRTAVSFG